MEGGSKGNKGNPYGQMCQSLLDLYDAADNVFNTISARIELEQVKLNKLTARIRASEAHIASLSGTTEAITLYSSAKYPQMPPEQADFVPLFGGKETKLPIATISLDAGQHQDGEEGTLELFRFFSETNHEYWPRESQRMDDIGSMPKNIKSVVDAMVFNSSELPYHQYRVVDNLAGADISVGEEEPKNKPAPLAAPPQSVLARDALTSLGVEEYGFRPTLGEVPSFRLPSTLPNLPMVADISWSGSSRRFDSMSIAPSAGHRRTASFGDGSAVGTPTKSDTASLDGSMHGIEEAVSPAPRIRSKSSLSTPLVESRNSSGEFSSELPVFSRKETANQPSLSPQLPAIITRTKIIKAAAPPPPPPPPPPRLPPLPAPRVSIEPMRSSPVNQKEIHAASSSGPSKQTEGGSSPSILPPVDNTRAALMASIRNPGIQLRKTGSGESPKPSAEKVVGQTGEHSGGKSAKPIDVLAEMATTLKMRRLSMRGATHDKDQVPVKLTPPPTRTDEMDAASVSSESNSTRITLPIKNLHAYIARKNQEASDDDDWEE